MKIGTDDIAGRLNRNDSYLRATKGYSERGINTKGLKLLYYCEHIVFDPHGRPTVMADSDHYFHTSRLSISTFLNPAKQNKFQVRIMFSLQAGLWAWPRGSLMTHMPSCLVQNAIDNSSFNNECAIQ